MSETKTIDYLKDWNAPTFNGYANEDVQLWICNIRYGLKQRRVARRDWAAVAQRFLGEELQEVMKTTREGIEKLEPEGWTWDRFTTTLILIHERVKKDAAENDPESVGATLCRLRRDHPVKTAAAGIGLIALGGVAVGPAVVVGTLHLLGLTVSGVLGGSIAVAAGPIQVLSAGAMALGAYIGIGDYGNDSSGATKQLNPKPLDSSYLVDSIQKELNSSRIAESKEGDSSVAHLKQAADSNVVASREADSFVDADSKEMVTAAESGSKEVESLSSSSVVDADIVPDHDDDANSEQAESVKSIVVEASDETSTVDSGDEHYSSAVEWKEGDSSAGVELKGADGSLIADLKQSSGFNEEKDGLGALA
ncbi:hypothetical protein B0H16DRAFT_89415 [Mycena metata]|uniref:Uncharacterized protein n=1 Tax=Mycena metata TaxID=1033252 RepID=A0AAD7N0E4_9AGAR|nr:hypothetical protein B0H16DRAFT_89415 [Mycena metata]